MSTLFSVEIFSKETINPSSSTLPALKNIRLSLLDQFMPEIYPSLVYFYPNNHADHEVGAHKSTLLKASLSETLTDFYPFAGEFQYNDSICCDDRGASFIEARVNCRLSELMTVSDADKLQCLIPCPGLSTQADAGYLVLAQLNLFECGGIAIALCISHKVADGFTASAFINRWSAKTALAPHTITTTNHLPILRDFHVAASLYPPQGFLNSSKPLMKLTQGEKCTTRRFVFNASCIAALKVEAASADVPNPTRVEVVSALIWKCAMQASRVNFGTVRPSSWRQAVNLRSRAAQTENLLGNLLWCIEAKTTECEVGLQSLVATIRECKNDYEVNYPDGVSAEDICQSLIESANNFGMEGIDRYVCTSLCRLPFYETDFGWGKPLCVTNCGADYKNVVTLMDTRDGNGIDASMTFLEEDMAIVESSISKAGASMRGEEKMPRQWAPLHAARL